MEYCAQCSVPCLSNTDMSAKLSLCVHRVTDIWKLKDTPSYFSIRRMEKRDHSPLSYSTVSANAQPTREGIERVKNQRASENIMN